MKKVYLAVDFINEQYCIGFYTSKYASTHFSALAKHLGIDVKRFILLTPTEYTGIKGLEKMIYGVYNDKYQLLNKSQKVNAYIYRHIERKITPELTLLREVFLAKYDLSDIEGCENETPIEIVEDCNHRDFIVVDLPDGKCEVVEKETGKSFIDVAKEEGLYPVRDFNVVELTEEEKERYAKGE